MNTPDAPRLPPAEAPVDWLEAFDFREQSTRLFMEIAAGSGAQLSPLEIPMP